MISRTERILRLLERPLSHGLPSRTGSSLLAWLQGYLVAAIDHQCEDDPIAQLCGSLLAHFKVDLTKTSMTLSEHVQNLSGGDDYLAFDLVAAAIREVMKDW